MDREIGIQGYATGAPGIGGTSKAAPEDFVVDEVPAEVAPRADGRYLLVRVTSRNWETNRLVRELARALGISRRRIRFAGTKDKRAVTTQRMTLQGVDPEALEAVGLRDVEVEPLHRVDHPLRLGDLRGNRFRIRLRKLAVSPEEAEAHLAALAGELANLGGFPNWFGPQRFGDVRPISHRVGRAMVQGRLEDAVLLYVAETFPGEPEASRQARERFAETRDPARALRDFPAHLGFERALLQHLREHPGDHAGALQNLPRNLLALLVHAYQSLLFNRILSRRLQAGLPLRDPVVGDLLLPQDRQGLPQRDVPVPVSEANLAKARRQSREGKAWVSGLVVGTEAPLAAGPMGRIEREVLEEEGVRRDAFAVPALPRLASRGLRRELLASVRDFDYRVDDQGAVLTFVLPPGSYASVLLREVTKARDSP